MFEIFTGKAIEVIKVAQEEARRMGHNYVGTEQILLGLIGEGTGIAAQILRVCGINIEDARVEVEKIIGRGSGFVAVEVPFTPMAKRLLELSVEELCRFKDSYVGTEHLLIALAGANVDAVGNRVLVNLGVDPAAIRKLVLYTLGVRAEGSQRKKASLPDPSAEHTVPVERRQPLKVFLAHAKEDKSSVIELHTRLKAAGYQPWLDQVDLIPGQNWRSIIPKVIRASNVFVACLSQKSIGKGGFVQKELKLALNHFSEQPPDTIYFIPIRLEECEIPDLRQEDYGVNLRDLHWVDYWQEGSFENLLRALEHVEQSKLS